MPAGAALLLLGVAACGSDGGSGGEAAGGSGESSGSVATSEIEGIGTVLVDSEGRTLYTSEQEADGTVHCVDTCLEFWIPAIATGTVSGDEMGTVTREDTGEKQLTYDGAPLYTFKLDTEAGQASGDNLSDSFDGEDFTWHAAVTDESEGGGGSTEEPDTGY